MTLKACAAALTIPKYMENTYLYAYKSQITCVGTDSKGTFIKLAQTIFHPQGGGQPCDIGFIKQAKVIDVQKEKIEGSATCFDIKHYVAEQDVASLSMGQEVTMTIDPMRRIGNARLHTCGHLIAALVETYFPSLKAVGGHHIPLQANVQFKSEEPISEELKQQVKTYLSEKLPIIIADKLPIYILSTEEGRKIQIQGFPAVGCGGTHLGSTSEIDEAVISGVTLKKGELKVSYKVHGEDFKPVPKAAEVKTGE